MNGNPRQSYIPVFELTAAVGPSVVILPASNQVRAARAEICRMALERGIPLIAAEREQIETLCSIRNLIDAYKEDGGARHDKPLSIAVFAPPGAGKSSRRYPCYCY